MHIKLVTVHLNNLGVVMFILMSFGLKKKMHQFDRLLVISKNMQTKVEQLKKFEGTMNDCVIYMAFLIRLKVFDLIRLLGAHTTQSCIRMDQFRP